MKSPRRMLSVLMAAIALLVIIDGGVISLFNDSEVSVNNGIRTYTPLRWLQTTMEDFTNGTVQEQVATQTHDGQVEIEFPALTDLSSLFALRGGSTSNFYRFNLTSRVWTSVNSTPANVGGGGYLAYDGTLFIYAFRGAGTTDFWRYNVLTGVWTSIRGAPATVSAGASLYFYEGMVYALRGGGTGEVWSYEPFSNTWTTLTTTFPPMNDGSSLVVYNGYLYIIRPSTTGNTNVFIRGNLTATSWVALSVVNYNTDIGPGASIVHGQGGMLLATRGKGHPEFYEYSVQTNTWLRLKNYPWNIKTGGDLAFDGSRTWGLCGDLKTNFAYYTRSLDTWTKSVAVPGTVGAGGNLVFVSSSAVYYTNGSLNSTIFDSGKSGQRYDSIFWDESLPPGTDISFKARASDTRVWVPFPDDPDNGTWDLSGPWTSLGSGSPVSLSGLTGRYIQWRAELFTADITRTPILYEVRMYYGGY